jgi:NAD(P)-dependent dehydrogenase (short-subunit alcohol dehydrogenase family)
MIEGLLKGKSIVITGAGSGVGRAASQLFAQHGARLIVTDVQESWLEETVAQVKDAGGEVKAVRCDVTRRADLDAAVKAAVDAYGRLDVMYNNAGIATPMKAEGGMKSFTDNTEDDIERLYAVNVKGVLFGCQAAIEQFRRQGGGGTIVNTASAAGLIGWGGTLYGSTKGAVVNLVRTLAMEVAKEGIRVNNVNPGSMATHFGVGAKGPLPQQALDSMAKIQPLGRIIDPMDCANAALFLASDLSSNITGINLPIDGGVSAGR